VNDPHVVALLYRMKLIEGVTFSEAPPLEFEVKDFRGCLTDNELRIEIKGHIADVESAKAVVEPFLDAWELDAALAVQRREFRFVFERPEVIDRSPIAGIHGVMVASMPSVQVFGRGTVQVERVEYPPPPPAFAVNAMVRQLWDRYEAMLDGREPVPSAGYYCYTALETLVPRETAKADRATWPAEHLNVALPVLDMLQYLTNRGDGDARKFSPSPNELTHRQLKWVRTALQLLIRRLGQRTADEHAVLEELTMNDLPKLEDDFLAEYQKRRDDQKAQQERSRQAQQTREAKRRDEGGG
jgi:hypothetical protein